MSALTYMALGALGWHLLTRKPKEDPTLGGRLVLRPVSYGPKPPAYTCPEALAWHAEQARLEAIEKPKLEHRK